MRFRCVLTTSLFLTVFGLAPSQPLRAQAASVPFATWQPELPPHEGGEARLPFQERSATRTHTTTGLLIGSIIGATVTTVFLLGFCGDPDTACGADEVGRGVVLIALPCAAAGALIGSLVRTKQ